MLISLLTVQHNDLTNPVQYAKSAITSEPLICGTDQLIKNELRINKTLSMLISLLYSVVSTVQHNNLTNPC